MGKHEKTLNQILRGTADANITFEDARKLLIHLGFEERIRSSHHIFRKAGITDKINIQKSGNKAKPYQIRQIRATILRYHLAGKENV